MGMKDLFLNHPEELKLHRYAVIEKLRERMSDDEIKTVRENLYQLFKLVILPGCKEVIYHLFLACLCKVVAWTLLNL
jgi:pre-rRNA-processing protein IPI1